VVTGRRQLDARQHHHRAGRQTKAPGEVPRPQTVVIGQRDHVETTPAGLVHHVPGQQPAVTGETVNVEITGEHGEASRRDDRAIRSGASRRAERDAREHGNPQQRAGAAHRPSHRANSISRGWNATAVPYSPTNAVHVIAWCTAVRTAALRASSCSTSRKNARIASSSNAPS
jgi:hypothetical protein